MSKADSRDPHLVLSDLNLQHNLFVCLHDDELNSCGLLQHKHSIKDKYYNSYY